MKRQTLQIGSALLATTALSSMAAAGTVINASSVATGTTLTPIVLSSQVFGGLTPEGITLGPVAFNFDFTNPLTSKFTLQIDSTNSDFNTAATVAQGLYSESGATLQAATSFNACTVQVLTNRIILADCLDESSNAASVIDVIQVSGIVFDEANGLATSGTTIALSGSVVGSVGGTFETITSANVISAATSLTSAVRTGTAGTVLNTSTPPFTQLTGPTVFFNLGSVVTSNPGALATDLATAIAAVPSNVTSGIAIQVTHNVLTDNAVVDIEVATPNSAVVTRLPSAFNGNIASFGSFTVAALNTLIQSFDIDITFDGSDAIEAWTAGTVDVTFSVGGAVNLVAPPAVTGALASLSRAGMSVQVNTAQSSTGAGATFNSLLRIVNNGTVAGPATITVVNDATGAALGTHTTASIPTGSTLQVSIPDIETGAGITPDGGQYGLTISGPFTGYAQHVMFNTVTESLVDLSGFRIGAGANNP